METDRTYSINTDIDPANLSRPLYSSRIDQLLQHRDAHKRSTLADIIRQEFRDCSIQTTDGAEWENQQLLTETIQENHIKAMLVALNDEMQSATDVTSNDQAETITAIALLERDTKKIKGYIALFVRMKMLKIVRTKDKK